MTYTATTRFAHQRLEAYHLALELFAGVEEFTADLPRGFADLTDQARRAAAATVRHIAEGANRIHPRDKAARFMVARGEAGEVDAVLHMVQVIDVGHQERVAHLRQLGDRVGAMLLGLIRRQRAGSTAASRACATCEDSDG